MSDDHLRSRTTVHHCDLCLASFWKNLEMVSKRVPRVDCGWKEEFWHEFDLHEMFRRFDEFRRLYECKRCLYKTCWKQSKNVKVQEHRYIMARTKANTCTTQNCFIQYVMSVPAHAQLLFIHNVWWKVAILRNIFNMFAYTCMYVNIFKRPL